MENNQIIKSIGQAYQQVQEKLKGGQKKLDKDGDGDIDGSDFAMMRKKKKMDEADYDAKDDHNMDPTSHVQQDKKTGMFCVYNMKNQKVAEFKTKAEADAYAKKNHDDLMKPPAGTKDIRKEQNELAPKGMKMKKPNEMYGMKKKKHDEQNELAPKGMKMKKHKEQNELAPKGMKMKKKMGEDEVVMNPKKKKQNGEKGANSDSNMAQENTKWPIYQRIMGSFVRARPSVGPLAKPAVMSRATCINPASSTDFQIMPHSSAFSALRGSAVMANPLARASPIRCGRCQLPPVSGINPTFAKD